MARKEFANGEGKPKKVAGFALAAPNAARLKAEAKRAAADAKRIAEEEEARKAQELKLKEGPVGRGGSKRGDTIEVARTKRAQAKYLEVLGKGWSKTMAAKEAGIDPATAISWEKRYPEFARQVLAALDQGCDVLEDYVRKAASTDWRAATRMLETRRSAQWNLKQRMEHSGTIEHEHKIEAASAEQDRKRIEELERRLGIAPQAGAVVLPGLPEKEPAE